MFAKRSKTFIAGGLSGNGIEDFCDLCGARIAALFASESLRLSLGGSSAPDFRGSEELVNYLYTRA